MPSPALKTLDASTSAQWRRWLSANHQRQSEIWLIFHKRHTGRSTIEYEDAVDEALCFGWIDSLIRRIDDDRYARKFTPRKPDSRWSTANRKRYARLKAAGRLAPAGLRLRPTHRDGDAPRPSLTQLPAYIEQALRRHPAARQFFQALAPSHRRNYIAWIDSAKQQSTKTRRLEQAITLLAAGHKPAMK
jgi:uncharacterized protein YdeI (YjbR/CyaY-like superfamily)